MKKLLALLILSLSLHGYALASGTEKATLFNPDTCERKIVTIGEYGIFDGGWELETPQNNCDSPLPKLGVSTADSNLPLTLASFETSLATGLSANATSSMTLVSATDDDGNTLSGWYGFTLDSGSTLQEYIIANCSGTACIDLIRGVSVADGQTSVSALQKAHRRGASVKITDHPNLVIMTQILNGNDGVPAKLYYDSQPSFTTDEDIITKKYADDLAYAGAPNASETDKGIVELSTGSEAAAGTSIGGTGARGVLPTSLASSTPTEETNIIPITGSNGKLSDSFTDFSLDKTFTGNNTHTGANTFNATSTMATTTFSVIPTIPATTPTNSTDAISKNYFDSARNKIDYYKNTQSSVTVASTGVDYTIYSFCSSGGLGVNDILQIKTLLRYDESSGNSTYKFYFGNGTATSTILSYTPAAVNNPQTYDISIYNRNSVSSQYINGYKLDNVTLALINSTATIDLSSKYCMQFTYANSAQTNYHGLQEYLDVIILKP